MLVEAVQELQPGAALDVGSGEGADAIWLATYLFWLAAIWLAAAWTNRSAALLSAAQVVLMESNPAAAGAMTNWLRKLVPFVLPGPK